MLESKTSIWIRVYEIDRFEISQRNAISLLKIELYKRF